MLFYTILANSGRVLVHCKGGLGRAGTIAARLLVKSGVAAEQAISTVRVASPQAIENREQERRTGGRRARRSRAGRCRS